MQRRKDVNNGLKEASFAAHTSGKGCKTISKQFGVQLSALGKIIQKRKAFKGVADLLKWTTEHIYPKARPHNAQRSIKKMLKSMTAQLEEDWTSTVCLEGFPTKNPLPSKKNMETRLRFTKLPLNKPQNFHNSARNSQCHGWWKPSTETPHTNCQAWWWRTDCSGMFCSHMTVAHLSLWEWLSIYYLYSL